MTFFFAHQLNIHYYFFLLISSKIADDLFLLIDLATRSFERAQCFSSDRPWRPKSNRPTGKMPGVPAAQSTSAYTHLTPAVLATQRALHTLFPISLFLSLSFSLYSSLSLSWTEGEDREGGGQRRRRGRDLFQRALIQLTGFSTNFSRANGLFLTDFSRANG